MVSSRNIPSSAYVSEKWTFAKIWASSSQAAALKPFWMWKKCQFCSTEDFSYGETKNQIKTNDNTWIVSIDTQEAPIDYLPNGLSEIIQRGNAGLKGSKVDEAAARNTC